LDNVTAYDMDKHQREAMLDAIAKGQITITEAATLSGLPRLTVTRWTKAAGINTKTARNQYIRLLWWRIMSGKRRPKWIKTAIAHGIINRTLHKAKSKPLI